MFPKIFEKLQSISVLTIEQETLGIIEDTVDSGSVSLPTRKDAVRKIFDNILDKFTILPSSRPSSSLSAFVATGRK